MFKKVLIAAVAVALGLVVVNGTKLGSYVRLFASKARQSVESSIPPEQEIARLRMEVQNLKKDDDKHVDKVARLAVEVQKMERELANVKSNLTRSKAQIRQLDKDLGDSSFVLYQGQRFTRDDLLAEALAYKTAEDTVKSKEESLQAKRRILALEKKKLNELQIVRNQMSAEIDRLDADLINERHAQAANESCIDDSSYRAIRKDMESVRERLDILKEKRELRGEIRLPILNDRQKQEKVKAQNVLDDIRNDAKKEVADGK